MSESQASALHVDNVCNEIVSEIAELEDVDPLDVTPPIYEVVDPEALGQIFASTPLADQKDSKVIFSYNGYEVAVRGDGDVSVERKAE